MPLLEASKQYKPFDVRKVGRQICLTLGLAILALKLPLLFGVVVPAPGFEWLNYSELTFAALMFIFGAALLSDSDKPIADRRFEAVAFGVAALITAWFAITRFFGV
jgi:hypothetical protein